MNTEKEKQAIKYLQMFAPSEKDDPYYLAYSGGKDSDAILILAELAGVRFEAVHNLTTVDAPETVYYVRSKQQVHINRPEMSMWQLIIKKLIPPTRLMRYCCSELKECGGEDRRVITGVRRYESVSRNKNGGLVKILKAPKHAQKEAEIVGAEYKISKQGGLILNNDNDESRQLVEHCVMRHKILINPIFDWTDSDVWDFLRHYSCESNPLYQFGFKRIGCIGCPLARKNQRYLQFHYYPKYKGMYIKTFDKMLTARRERGLPTQWQSGEEVFKWWMQEDPTQLSFDDI